MKNYNKTKGQLGNGTLFLELMLVVAMTATIASHGFRMIDTHHELSEEMDAKNEAIIASARESWSAEKTEELLEVDGTVVSMNVVQRNW